MQLNYPTKGGLLLRVENRQRVSGCAARVTLPPKCATKSSKKSIRVMARRTTQPEASPRRHGKRTGCGELQREQQRETLTGDPTANRALSVRAPSL